MRHSSVVVLWWCLAANPHDGDYVLRLLGIRVECLVFVINEAFGCALGATTAAYTAIQPYVRMSRSVVETIISGGALWAIMMANCTLELLKWQNCWEPLRQLWQTSQLMWSVNGSAWKGRWQALHMLLPTHQVGLSDLSGCNSPPPPPPPPPRLRFVRPGGLRSDVHVMPRLQ
jgi:hypothetical protein